MPELANRAALFRGLRREVLPETPPAASEFGIVEIRRGGRCGSRTRPQARGELVADAWRIGFVDAVGEQGLFGQVKGRNGTPVADWLSAQPVAWQAGALRCHRSLPHLPRRRPPRPAPWDRGVRNSPSDTLSVWADASPGNSTVAGPVRIREAIKSAAAKMG